MQYTATIEEENKEIASRYKDLLKGTYEILSLEEKLENLIFFIQLQWQKLLLWKLV